MPAPASTDRPDRVQSVSQLTALLKGVIETAFADVWVAGEISNFSRPQSGHCYLTLKDDAAQLRAVIWRGTASRLRVDLRDGVEVICRGRLDLYPPRGSYQLVIDELHLQGEGAVEAALRKLREKLAAEGLFAAERKRPLPRTPRRIGVVTSPTGAAIRDFLEVLRRRWRGVEVLILPTRVQGDGAAKEIAAAIANAARIRPELDVLVVTRGGGSLEDLWCFNEEPVVRAIAGSPIPTISAIGHEIDVTLSDLAADVRALTPSEAAERVAPAASEMTELVASLHGRMRRALVGRAEQMRAWLDALASRPALARPADGVRQLARRADELSQRLDAGVATAVRDNRGKLGVAAGRLEALSPLAVLGRGYSLTQRDGRLVASVSQLKAGDLIATTLADGVATSLVESVEKKTLTGKKLK
ncbi:MAG: exodeoxyribonuclease VII large subunit [Planctomycetales bacterium]|nr:exodeoxyribonuclease VII large subunit [Planctomycetales bacterium]